MINTMPFSQTSQGPTIFNPAFIAIYPFAKKEIRKKTLQLTITCALPLDEKTRPDSDTISAALLWFFITDHYIWKGYYSGDESEYLEPHPTQQSAIEWAKTHASRNIFHGECYTPEIYLDHETFWTDEKLLYAHTNSKKQTTLEEIESSVYTCDYHSRYKIPKEKLIEGIKQALKIEFHPGCHERIINTLKLMLSDIMED